ncbi:PREDICTED: IgG receptor FcRn large subunit p51 [Myotis davidii]|uniref:IgG receptor FcRn large subunit p51 n=1 Tax=Myotis davidii TaxID=225400 RepID=UPI000767125B|nr:PREDICTED: IgG receptor FcRn large subunit p51 [Myotis davidii]
MEDGATSQGMQVASSSGERILPGSCQKEPALRTMLDFWSPDLRDNTTGGGLGVLSPGSAGGGPAPGPCSPLGGTPGSYILQGLLGCEMGPDNSTAAVATFALNGEEFMKFDPKAGNWDGDWPEARAISQKWRQRLLGHLETGRSNLEWKGHPACHGWFLPGAGGGASRPRTCAGWPLRCPHPLPAPAPAQRAGGPLNTDSVSLAADSSAKPLVPVVGIVIGFLLLMAVAAGGAVLWWRMKRGLPAPWILLRGDDLGALLPTGPSKDADS